MFLLALFILQLQATRTRRASQFRQENASLLPRNFGTLSPFRDDVVAMVAVQLRSTGKSKAKVRTQISHIFTHGCHCGWNYKRYELTDKSRKPNDQLDKVCLDFEHCSECLNVDGCTGANSEPSFNGTAFTCDHLSTGCQRNKCECSVNMVNKLTQIADEVETQKLTFNEFMDTCVTEVDASINTEMGARSQSFNGERYRQCCGQYPDRKPYTYSGLNGMSCCANTIYNQKFQYCCENGSLSRIGDVCW